jgi:isoleucyl-tRNA synthetase
MEVAKRIFEAGSSVRQKAGIKLRHPVKKVTVVGGPELEDAATKFSEVVKRQLNAKTFEYAQELSGTTYEVKPNYKALGPKYGKDAPKVADALKKNPAKAKSIVDSGREDEVGGFKVTADMITEIIIKAPDDHPGESFSFEGVSGVVYVDTRRDESLMREALARELIRNIQELRKKHRLGELDRITVKYSGSGRTDEILEEYGPAILEEVRADEIKRSEGAKEAAFSFEGEEVGLSISF